MLLGYNQRNRKTIMNWKKFTLLSSVAIAALAISAAPALAQSHGHSGGGRSFSGGSSAHFARSGNWHGNGNWNGGRGWHHRGGTRIYFGGFGYPYGYGFYPYAWGYGYPYYGSAAAVYYNGYNDGRVYEGRPVDNGGSVVADVQEELARGGYYRGAIDGVMGPETRNALRRYQRRNGLSADGQIGGETLSSMGLQ